MTIEMTAVPEALSNLREQRILMMSESRHLSPKNLTSRQVMQYNLKFLDQIYFYVLFIYSCSYTNLFIIKSYFCVFCSFFTSPL